MANRESKIENEIGLPAVAGRNRLLSEGWARQDSNLGPRDYESPALTAELQAPAVKK
jgi:hypothetical protein